MDVVVGGEEEVGEKEGGGEEAFRGFDAAIAATTLPRACSAQNHRSHYASFTRFNFAGQNARIRGKTPRYLLAWCMLYKYNS